jgi:dienelactone hydrolase
MRYAALLTLLALAGRAAAQDEGKTVPPPRMLYTYLQGEAQKYFDARRQTVAALQTPADVRRRQQELKARFVQALGGFPEKTPLNARVVGRLPGDGFRAEKVIYESRPNHHVTAVLYLPDGKPPFPGVLVPCGHSANGKAAEPYQRACILLAKNGLAALCYDPIGQGERSQILDATGKPALAGNTSEHTMVGVGALLVGRNTATYRIWDGIRSLDYLASRPDIDPARLGCTGNSGGGTLTAYLMALDDRIVAAAPSCYLTSLERLFATIGPQDAEQNITGQVAFGMEHADYLTLRAPRPTLMCVATQDYFDIQGAWTTFREATRVYGLLGHGERVALFEYNDKHGFSRPRREAALRWLRRWLLGKDDAPTEGDFPVFTDAQLQCTRGGQVLEDFQGKSVVHFNIEAEEELARRREQFQATHSRAELLEEVRRLIGLAPQDRLPVRPFLESTPGVMIAEKSWAPENANARSPVVLYLHDTDPLPDARPGGPIDQLVKAGNRVVAVNLHGMGPTAPGGPTGRRPGYFGTDSKEAFLALHLGRPLLGQRVSDVLDRLGPKATGGYHLVGVGACGPIALHAAALDARVAGVTLERSVLSWSNVVRTPMSMNQLTNVVPGALRIYDLPDLAALVAPRPLTIRNSVDAAQRPVPQTELERAYRRCIDEYARQQARGRLNLESSK